MNLSVYGAATLSEIVPGRLDCVKKEIRVTAAKIYRVRFPRSSGSIPNEQKYLHAVSTSGKIWHFGDHQTQEFRRVDSMQLRLSAVIRLASPSTAVAGPGRPRVCLFRF